jgi:hypothetical protein
VRALFDPDQFQPGRKPSRAGAVVGLAILAAAVVIDTLAFDALFGTDYVHWYVDHGDVATLVFVFVTLAWGDVNKMTGLISAHPMQYLLASYALGALPSLALSALVETRRGRGEAHGLARTERGVAPIGLGLLDELVTVLASVAFLAAFVAWLLVVAPLQYVVYLVAGAPAREALASAFRAWALVTDRGLAAGVSLKRRPMRPDAIESGFSAQPVAFTAAVAAALLFALSKLVE